MAGPFLPLISLALGLVVTNGAAALDIPTPSPHDPRIRIAEYKPNEVIRVQVQRGVVTRVILEPNEQILVPAVGLSSECTNENDEWCISAIKGTNQIFVRPRDNARRNNMELQTNKRDYSFAFEVADQRRGTPPPFYRVVMRYPDAKPKLVNAQERAAVAAELLRRTEATERPLPQAIDPDYGMSPGDRLKHEGIAIRNTNYTKQILEKGEDADPTMVFDDGRFTYFEFPGAREIPAIFAYGSDGEPTRVNWHMQGAFVVVQRTARKFTLRLGDATVGVFNEAFDPTGIETPTATVSDAVRREIREAP